MSINNRRARCAVRVASWILRTFAPDYSRVLNNMWRAAIGAQPCGSNPAGTAAKPTAAHTASPRSLAGGTSRSSSIEFLARQLES
ncbi:hypothetical protein SEA_MICHLEY_59 [Mycobacterium phage Michley]|nr:hypothetical protein SEA_MICHLEY_59 [Mycobacterium phage Michley]